MAIVEPAFLVRKAIASGLLNPYAVGNVEMCWRNRDRRTIGMAPRATSQRDARLLSAEQHASTDHRRKSWAET